MTINIVIAGERSILIGADFRLTNADSGRVISDSSSKLLIAQEHGWRACITYSGIGRWNRRDTSKYVEEWLSHHPDVELSFEEAIRRIEERSNAWISIIRRQSNIQYGHCFLIAGLVADEPTIAVISDSERLHGPRAKGGGALVAETRASRNLIFVGGSGVDGVSRALRRGLRSASARGEPPHALHAMIGNAVAEAASVDKVGGTVSPESFSYSFTVEGREEGHLHGGTPGGLQIERVINGQNPLSAIRGLLPKGVTIVPTGRVSSVDRDSSCSGEVLSDGTDTQGEKSGYILVGLDSGPHGEANSINSNGVVAGIVTPVRHRAIRGALWDGTTLSLLPEHVHWVSALNDEGSVAGSLQPGNNTAGFLLQDTRLLPIETLGGTSGSVIALNNRGQVVGESWTLPGSGPGDKRPRAFLWSAADGIRDIGSDIGDFNSRATGINDAGQIVGFFHPPGVFAGPIRGFLRNLDGHLTRFENASPMGVSNSGQVFGLFGRASFVWNETDGFQQLDLSDSGSIVALSDAGHVVYTRHTVSGVRAAVRHKERDVLLPTYKGHQSEAKAVNRHGVIAGHVFSRGHSHPVKWVPVD